MNYLQKKKQAIIMMLAAQIIKTAEGYPVVINDCKSGAANDYTVWGNTVTGKNLIPYPYYETTKTENGITFTDNGDGTITVNGTAKSNATFRLIHSSSAAAVDTSKRYVLSGCPSGGGTSTYLMSGYDTVNGYADTGRGIAFYPKGNAFTLFMRVYSGATVDNLTFSPQLELGNVATEYEPFGENHVGDKVLLDNTYKYRIPITNSDSNRASATVNIYLDEPLKKGESVNFGADNLPELQLFEGSNIITVNTEVKPEKVVIDYYEKG